MKISVVSALLTFAMFAGLAAPANAQPPAAAGGPYTPSLMTIWPDNTPLAFGMNVGEVSQTLGVPLSYVSGRRGNEIYLAVRDTSGIILFSRRDPIYLQFRRGRLTGWKGESGYHLPYLVW